MNNKMGDFWLRYYKDIIGISVLGFTATPNWLNTSRIHCRVSGYGKILKMTKYGMRFLMVIGKPSG